MKTMRHPARPSIHRWLIILGASCLVYQSAHAALLFQEGFNYPTNTALSGNDGWTLGNSKISITNAPLTYDSLADTTPTGYALSEVAGTATSTIGNFNASAITGGTVYFSFILSPTVLPTANQELLALLPSGSTGPGGSGDPLGIYVGAGTLTSTYKVGPRHNGSGATYVNTAAMTLHSTNFVVVAYTFNPSTSDDSVSLWFDPVLGGSMPVADTSMSGGADAANVQIIGFKAQSSSNAGNWLFDTLRVGTTWEDVTLVVPEPSTFALMGIGLGLVAAMIRCRRS